MNWLKNIRSSESGEKNWNMKVVLRLEVALSWQVILKIAMLNSGLVRGGSGGSADPPKILEPVEKKLEIDILS